MQLHANAAIYTISAIATGGVMIRPWRFPEAIWAMLGAAALVAFGLISRTDAVTGILKGLDVYYFLAGMMLLAELARREGLFHHCCYSTGSISPLRQGIEAFAALAGRLSNRQTVLPFAGSHDRRANQASHRDCRAG
jgi:hypothetical protein